MGVEPWGLFTTGDFRSAGSAGLPGHSWFSDGERLDQHVNVT